MRLTEFGVIGGRDPHPDVRVEVDLGPAQAAAAGPPAGAVGQALGRRSGDRVAVVLRLAVADQADRLDDEAAVQADPAAHAEPNNPIARRAIPSENGLPAQADSLPPAVLCRRASHALTPRCPVAGCGGELVPRADGPDLQCLQCRRSADRTQGAAVLAATVGRDVSACLGCTYRGGGSADLCLPHAAWLTPPAACRVVVSELPGRLLREFLAGGPPLADGLAVLDAVLAAVGELHARGFAHGQLTPDVIGVRPAADGFRAAVIGAGLRVGPNGGGRGRPPGWLTPTAWSAPEVQQPRPPVRLVSVRQVGHQHQSGNDFQVQVEGSVSVGTGDAIAPAAGGLFEVTGLVRNAPGRVNVRGPGGPPAVGEAVLHRAVGGAADVSSVAAIFQDEWLAGTRTAGRPPADSATVRELLALLERCRERSPDGFCPSGGAESVPAVATARRQLGELRRRLMSPVVVPEPPDPEDSGPVWLDPSASDLPVAPLAPPPPPPAPAEPAGGSDVITLEPDPVSLSTAARADWCRWPGESSADWGRRLGQVQTALWGSGHPVLVEEFLSSLSDLRGETAALTAVLDQELRLWARAEQTPPRHILHARLDRYLPDDSVVRSRFLPLTPVRVGEYVIYGPLGAGNMGTVLLARDLVLKRYVALKRPNGRDGGRASAEDLRRFRQEGEHLADIRHANVVRVNKSLELPDGDGTCPYLDMDLLPGPSLSAFISSAGGESGRWRMPVARAAEVVRQLARGVQAIHSCERIHRDIKPDNIRFDRAGRPVLVDLGLGRRVARESMPPPSEQSTRGPAGTVAYMAPESLRPPHPQNERTDQYALGVVLYQLLTGQLPYTLFEFGSAPAAPRDLNPHVPDRLSDACLRAVALDPDRRFASAGEFARALDDRADGDPRRSGESGAVRVVPPPAAADFRRAVRLIGRFVAGTVAVVLPELTAGASGVRIQFGRRAWGLLDPQAARAAVAAGRAAVTAIRDGGSNPDTATARAEWAARAAGELEQVAAYLTAFADHVRQVGPDGVVSFRPAGPDLTRLAGRAEAAAERLARDDPSAAGGSPPGGEPQPAGGQGEDE